MFQYVTRLGKSRMIEGGCFCRKIRYQIDSGQYLAVNCHCTMCRHIHAAPFVTWIVVPTDHFRYVEGSVATLKSSESGTRYFCSGCGTQIACINHSHPEVIDIAVGSLDLPDAMTPSLEVHTNTRLDWVGKSSNDNPVVSGT